MNESNLKKSKALQKIENEKKLREKIRSAFINEYGENNFLDSEIETTLQNILKKITPETTTLLSLKEEVSKVQNKKHYDFFEIKKLPTRYKMLDLSLGGGIEPLIYILAAESSVGKSTLALTLANNFAVQKRNVLFFSFEQTKQELLAKSISAIYNDIYFEDKDVPELSARNLREMDLSSEDCWRIKDVHDVFKKNVGPNLYISEPQSALTVEMIGDEIEYFVSQHKTEEAPVVFIDYLQMIDFSNPKFTDKQSADHIMKYLRYLKVQYGCPIIAISSVSRSSYRSPLTEASLKDSGGIEYGADVILTLQLHEICYQKREISEEDYQIARMENPRKIDIKCLKYRGFNAFWTAKLNYYPKMDLFYENRSITEDDDRTVDYEANKRKGN